MKNVALMAVFGAVALFLKHKTDNPVKAVKDAGSPKKKGGCGGAAERGDKRSGRMAFSLRGGHIHCSVSETWALAVHSHDCMRW
jgi:hypothetical protein